MKGFFMSGLISWAKRLLLRLQQKLGKSSTTLKLVLKLRNQTNLIMVFGFAGFGGGEKYWSSGNQRFIIETLAPQCNTFIDVGANVGDWTDQFLKYASAECRGLLFEPNPETYSTLLNRYHGFPLLEVCNKGLGSTDGQAEFFAEPNYGCSSTFVPGASCDSDARLIMAQITTLDSELKNKGLGGS